MPTTKMPVWMRSEYVTIGQPPFHKIRGQEVPSEMEGPTAYRYWQRRGNYSKFRTGLQGGLQEQSLDKRLVCGYNQGRKGTAGRRLALRS